MAEKRKDNKGRNLKQGESQRADERYMYRYNDYTGIRKSIYSWDLAELREKEKQIAKDSEDNINTNGAKKTLNKQIEDYIATKPKLSASTRNNYIYMWEKEIKDCSIGNKKLDTIVKSDIKKFYSTLSKKGFKNGTIQLYQNFLFPCFQLAVDDNLIRNNPCKDCMKEYKDDDATKKEALTKEQQKTLFNFLATNQYYNCYYPMVAFMIGTACRVGEVIGLTWNDVDMKEHTVNINHQLIYKKFDGEIKFRASKPKTNDGIRVIPMTKEVLEQVKEQRKVQLQMGIDRSITVDGYKGFIFTTKGGKPMQPNCINRFLFHIVDTYNKQEEVEAKKEKREPKLLPHISAHTLRHTGCTRMAESGIDVKALQYIMGHANISVTMDIYNHIDSTRVVSEMQKLEGIFKIS